MHQSFRAPQTVELSEYETELREGVGHGVCSALIGLVVRKPGSMPKMRVASNTNGTSYSDTKAVV